MKPFQYTTFAKDIAEKLLSTISPWLPSGILFLHQGRCGSSVVANLLGQNNKIRSYGEIFEQYFQMKTLPTRPQNILMTCRATSRMKFALVEVKFFENQHLSLLNADINNFIDLAIRCGYKKFIILDRKNYLRKVTSTLIGRKRGGKWKIKADESMPQPVVVNIDIDEFLFQGTKVNLIELFKYMDDQYIKLRLATKREDVLELTYETDILNNPIIAYNKVCQWLEIKPEPAKVNFQKANILELDKAIENWDEVVNLLRTTPYQWMTDLANNIT